MKLKTAKKKKHFTITISLVALIGVSAITYTLLLPILKRKDPEWLKKYCYAIVSSLPPPPFEFTEKGEIYGSGMSMYTKDMVSKEEHDSSYTCAIAYKFDYAEAYESKNLTYGPNMEVVNKFLQKTSEDYTISFSAPPKSIIQKLFGGKKAYWQKQAGLSDDKAGRPAYVTEGFPLVLTRENKLLRTKEVVDIFFGVKLYTKVTVYENNK